MLLATFFKIKRFLLKRKKTKRLSFGLSQLNWGKKWRFKEFNFKTGSSELLKGAEIKLVRLKDFLLLNSSIHIEIEGHVFEYGESTFAGRRMSLARANTVMKYLIDSGEIGSAHV